MIVKVLCILIGLTASFIILTADAMQALLLLAFAYLLSAFLFVWVGAEFAAIMLFIIYVGAVAVLFTIVIIALDLRRSQIIDLEKNYIPFGLLLGILYFLLILYMIQPIFLSSSPSLFYFNFSNILFYSENIKLFAETLYNYYAPFVGISALILLLAMVGSISLIADPERRSIYKVKNTTNFKKIYLWRTQSNFKKYDNINNDE